MRNIWTIGTTIIIVALAFWTGYYSYPVIQGLAEPVTAAPGAGANATPHPTDDGTRAELEGPPGNSDVARMRTFWEAWDILDRDFYGDKPDASARAYGAIRGLAETFADPYTYFLEPQPRQLERDELRGRFGGIGASIERTDAGFVLHPLIEQPADRAGIRAGDLLLSVDEQPILPHMDADAVVSIVRGPVGSTVNVRVQRESGASQEELDFAIERAEIETPSMEWELLPACAQASDADQACTTAGAPRIGYVRHTLFSERSPAEMEAAVTELQDAGATRFILDLRGNPGGLVSSAVGVADLWLADDTIYIEAKANGEEITTYAQAGELGEDLPLVVIVDGASASASEIVAGALQDHDRARVVGEQTFGKGSVQLIHELSDQSSIHVTNAEWFTPDRRRISPDGLTPDVVIVPGSDPLPQAVEMLARQ